MSEKKRPGKSFTEQLVDAIDRAADALNALTRPAPVPVPIPVRRPYQPPTRRRY